MPIVSLLPSGTEIAAHWGWAKACPPRLHRQWLGLLSRPGPQSVDSLEILGHQLHADVHPFQPGLPATIPVH